jgi:hypothetical protein
MLAELLRPGDTLGRPPATDALGRGASELDGARALLVGLAANVSLATGRAVRVADIIDLPATPRPPAPAGTRPSDRKEPTECPPPTG